MWVYQRTGKSLWTVGFYDPADKWHSDNDYDSRGDAADRVHYLNGGNLDRSTESISPELAEELAEIASMRSDY